LYIYALVKRPIPTLLPLVEILDKQKVFSFIPIIKALSCKVEEWNVSVDGQLNA